MKIIRIIPILIFIFSQSAVLGQLKYLPDSAIHNYKNVHYHYLVPDISKCNLSDGYYNIYALNDSNLVIYSFSVKNKKLDGMFLHFTTNHVITQQIIFNKGKIIFFANFYRKENFVDGFDYEIDVK